MVEQFSDPNQGKHRRLRLIPGFRTDQDPEEYDPNVLYRAPRSQMSPSTDPDVIPIPLVSMETNWLKGGPSQPMTREQHEAWTDDFLVDEGLHLGVVPPADISTAELLAGSSLGFADEPDEPDDLTDVRATVARSHMHIVPPPDDVL